MDQSYPDPDCAPLPLRRASDVVLRRRPPDSPTPPLDASTSRAGAARVWLAGYLDARGGSAESAAVRADAAVDGVSVATLCLIAPGMVRSESIRGVSHRTVWRLLAPGAQPSRGTSTACAQEWLVARLTASGGRAPSCDLRTEGALAGYRPRMLDRARVGLGLTIRTIPGAIPRRTEWLLPGVGADDEQSGGADAWLLDFLARSGGSVDSSLVRQVGARFGHNARALDRARLRRGIRSESVPGSFPRRTVWVLTAP